MVPLSAYLAFVAASVVLILIPGPNVALIVSQSLRHGARCGLLTVMGTSAAAFLQLALVVAGTATVLALFAQWFEVLRWIGVAYLVGLGIAVWRAPPKDPAKPARAPRPRAAFLRGFTVSLTNPKTLLFLGAFLPQFAAADRPLLPQLLLLSGTFLAIGVSLDSLWALGAGRARFVFARERLRNRLTGTILVGAGLGLALARRTP
jgi:homoserine/homoserine lactone efflux protein